MKIFQILAICLLVVAVEFVVADTLEPAVTTSQEIDSADNAGQHSTDMCCSCGCKKEKTEPKPEPKPEPAPEPKDTCGSGCGGGKDKDKTDA